MSNVPFTAEASCFVGVPVEDINGGGGALGLLVLANVCCFITCLCWIFNISGFSIIALAKLDLLLLMLMPYTCLWNFSYKEQLKGNSVMYIIYFDQKLRALFTLAL